MDNSGLSKKEYLKKYLSGGDKKKKKKKKTTEASITKSKIVDDDIDLKNMKPLNDDELEIFDLAEEAPQIVGIIDERPDDVKVMDEYRKTKKWKVVADEFGIENVKVTAIAGQKNSNEPEKDSGRKVSDSDESPPRKKSETFPVRIKEEIDSDASPPRNTHRYDSDASPPRKTRKAGLQKAEDVKNEIQKLKRKEKEMFERMPDDVTGRNAEAIVRNRKTGRRRDAKEEARLKREKEEKEAEKIAQYAVWGKGVKQVQDRKEKMEEELYEMSKPLARYKDDKDLEEMLKNQERDDDPMLEYIRQKKRKENGPSRPEYQGLYLPNRYDIKPGHKWDGVDRSNGYEAKWFEEQNARKARAEEAYKWSTEDM